MTWELDIGLVATGRQYADQGLAKMSSCVSSSGLPKSAFNTHKACYRAINRQGRRVLNDDGLKKSLIATFAPCAEPRGYELSLMPSFAIHSSALVSPSNIERDNHRADSSNCGQLGWLISAIHTPSGDLTRTVAFVRSAETDASNLHCIAKLCALPAPVAADDSP
jgi:hypothetical protein